MDRLLTLTEVGTRLGRRETKVRSYLQTGALRAVKLDGVARVRESDLDAFIAELDDYHPTSA